MCQRIYLSKDKGQHDDSDLNSVPGVYSGDNNSRKLAPAFTPYIYKMIIISHNLVLAVE